MRIPDQLRTATEGLKTNLGRSFLTILGIVIGVAAIVLVLSLGGAARELILREVQGIGGETLVVRPGRQPEGPSEVAQTLFSDSLKERDIIALRRKENVPGARSVDPAIFVPGSVTYQDQVYRPTIFGWNAETLAEAFDITPAEGTFFTEEDTRARAQVTVIGDRVRDELFGSATALGETIRIRGHAFRVVGVLDARGQVGFLNTDELVLVPYTTAQEKLLAISYVHEIFIRADDPSRVEEVAEDVRRTLREMHGITDPAKDDFFVATQQDILERIGTVTLALTVFLAAIAAISLVVGGIGIMNIMLVSVTERTREIGLRKAVGATNAEIRAQFLLEALLLTVTGGALGTVIALLFAALAAVVIRQQFSLPWSFQFSTTGILLGLGTAALVGLTFGLYPATRAARKDPIEALRYE
ncbi:MAG: Efflux ABC transporter, permease protein [Parcubacteria group bacterium Gr01-1014_38]|nr:MAG: Efflux ABC transporter, permease protein [Parcubacteria group bacterium Gr01-1014_38]